MPAPIFGVLRESVFVKGDLDGTAFDDDGISV
jgi:hypothetical protein